MASPTADGASRREDPPLVTGAAHYSDDLVPPGTLHAVFVRAPLAHGQILGIDPAPAAGLPGVAGVFTAADLDLPPMPAGGAPAAMARPVLATGTVRFLGEAVAVVVADSRARALDAAEAVEVDYEPLEVVTDPRGRAGRRRAPAVRRDGRQPGQGAALARAVPGPRGGRGGGQGPLRQPAGGRGPAGAQRRRGRPRARSATASSCTRPARRRSGCATTSPRRWAWPPSGSGWSSRRWAGPSGPGSSPTPSRSRWPRWPCGSAARSATSRAARRPCWP